MSSSGIAAPIFRNRILTSLAAEDLAILRPHLARVSLLLSQVLHERNRPISDVFFVEQGMVSLTADTSDVGEVEVGLIGREGFVGGSVLLNPEAIAVHRAVVQAGGYAYRISADVLCRAVDHLPMLRRNCLRYLELLLVQTSQAAACNARHNLPERLARWLSMVRDRLDDDEMPMTQEFLAVMLGVRRAGVSVATGTLQSAGLIRQSRGRIRVMDRAGLAAAACNCYHILRQTSTVAPAGPQPEGRQRPVPSYGMAQT